MPRSLGIRQNRSNNMKIKHTKRWIKDHAKGLSSFLVAAASIAQMHAGTFTNNFNVDPTGSVTLDGTAPLDGQPPHAGYWVSSGGVGGSGYVSLADAVNSQYGLMVVSDLDAGTEVGGFTADFKLMIGGGSGNPADGFSFNWGADVPQTAGTVAWEEGAGTGLIVDFDIYDNGGGEAPTIDVKVGGNGDGNKVASVKLAKTDIMTGTTFANVHIQYKNGLLDVSYKGQPVFTSLPIGLAPQTGAVFGFGARTGGENANFWLDEVGISTFAQTAPSVTAVRGNAKGVTVLLQDAPTGALDTSTVTAKIDNVAVSGNAVKNGNVTTFSFTNPGLYTAGTSHTVELTYKYGSPAVNTTTSFSFLVGPYTTLPATAALAPGSVDTSKRGFLWRVHQIDSTADLENTLVRAENQLGGLMGDNVANPDAVGGADGASTAPNPPTAPIAFTVSNVINFGDDTSLKNNGRFTPDLDFPGIPGLTGDDDNIAGEVITAIEFPTPGLYRLVVNSDDGFRTTAGKNPRDPANPVLGFFDGGRGPTDSPYEVYVDTAGIYPFRTIWEEGGGGAGLEWFSELNDGTRLLLNDTATDPRALKTYQVPASALPAYLAGLNPAMGAKLIIRPKTIEAHLVDSGTTVTASSVTMKLNGTSVPATATKTGGDTKILYSPTGDLLPNTEYTVELTYTDTAGSHTTNYKFTTGPLSSTLFVVEAEDFDYSNDGVTGGLSNPHAGEPGLDVNVMPYLGGAYDALSAILNVDYSDDDPGDGNVYRTEDRGSADGNDTSMYDNRGGAGGNGAGGNLSMPDSERGTYTVTVNYSLGWSGGDWHNYTRNFPANGTGGWWEVYAGLSYGGEGPGLLSGTLQKVTSGAGTDTQTIEDLGTFNGPGSGGWGNNNLVPMVTASGAKAVVKLNGLNTIRYQSSSGDYDYLIFSAANPPPPSIDTAPLDSVKRDAVVLDWTLKDTDSQVNVSTVKVFLNNQDQTSKATITKTATGATIHVDLTGTTMAAGTYPWKITFSDNSSPAQNVSGEGTFLVNPYPTEGVFVIEAEDFNYSDDNVAGGKSNPLAGTPDQDVNVMPYLGGAYDTLGAVKGIDFNNNDDVLGQGGDLYRTEADPDPEDPNDPSGLNEVAIGTNNGDRYGQDRGTFTVTSNYKIGWTAQGDWANYTRTFPTNDYNVWAALSYGGRGGSQLRGSLDLVTSDVTKPNQTTQAIGSFDAPGSGGWSRNELVPMKTTTGDLAVVHMGGLQTVRFNMPSGDFDYLLFVPVGGSVGTGVNISVVKGTGQITISWSGGGKLQYTDVLGAGANWTDVPNGNTGSVSVPTDQAKRFYRVQVSP